MRRVICCGGRSYKDADRVREVLNDIHAHGGIALVIEGGASGADLLAREWAEENCIDVVTVFAEWAKHGRRAGPLRNYQMLGYNPDMVIAFPGGKGTANMVAQAKAAGVGVVEVS